MSWCSQYQLPSNPTNYQCLQSDTELQYDTTDTRFVRTDIVCTSVTLSFRYFSNLPT